MAELTVKIFNLRHDTFVNYTSADTKLIRLFFFATNAKIRNGITISITI